MNKMMTTLIAMNAVMLGVAGCADTTAPTASATAPTKTSMSYSSQSLGGAGLFSNINVPGATGRTIVPGDNSTIAGDEDATHLQQTSAFGGD
jgi:hypothetical protein